MAGELFFVLGLLYDFVITRSILGLPLVTVAMKCFFCYAMIRSGVSTNDKDLGTELFVASAQTDNDSSHAELNFKQAYQHGGPEIVSF